MNEFKNYLILNSDSKKTVSSYYEQVKLFLNFSKGECSQELINNYLTFKLEQKISKNTFNVILNALKKYVSFLKVEIEFPPYKIADKRIKEYLTEEKFKDSILSMIDLTFNRDTQKIDLILRLMFYTGLRKEEIVNLKTTDIDYEKEILIVKDTKVKKDRIIPFLNKKLFEDLKLISTEYVFPNLNITKIDYIFQTLKRELYLKSFHPHLVRTSFAKYCLAKGLDITFVQMLLGHSSITTTMIYAEPDQAMLIEACKKIRS